MPTPTRTRVAPRPGAVQKQKTMTSMATTPITTSKLASSPASVRNKMAAPAAKGPPNKSILSFFKKVPPPEESMFVAGSAGVVLKQLAVSQGNEENDTVPEVMEEVDVDLAFVEESRFNECTGSIKRRRLSEEQPAKSDGTAASKAAQRGPFVDDSDSDSDADDGDGANDPKHDPLPTLTAHNDEITTLSPRRLETHTSFDETFLKVTTKTPKKTEETAAADDSKDTDLDLDLDDVDFAGFADLDEEDDFAFAGEEFRERKYMEAQARLEADAVVNGDGSNDEAMTGGCPICGASLAGNTPDQATVHVNACLDGLTGASTSTDTPRDAPQPTEKTTENVTPTHNSPAEPKPTTSISGFSKRFMRTAQPRPGQANPIAFGGGSGPTGSSSSGGPGSAFAKLMLGHAEDEAWVTAAASEVASRGRPAYERTCPFYKIMPGFAICVDAFRYGAVEGCRAYFLSHFHSDHYIGLTAKWCHGPIYCSQVTASLVRSQLGTAAKYVVALDFETTVDVPGIDGVRVTMIPANHCPGSSMFLFEKTMQPTGRIHRILHCGDFRACRAHVDHPLLAPDTLDALSKKRQQRIDVCYLDTTYLNPRYSFPPQDDVVSACATLCATLDQSLRAGEEGEWNKALRRREASGGDGSGNVKDFFKRTSGDNETPVQETPVQAPPRDALAGLGRPPPPTRNRNRLLVICGTYSIGKERICKAIAQALSSKIYASPAKIKIVAQLGDAELTALMTSDATEAQVHMQMLMELRAETLAEYLDGYKAHFSRIVGFRPSGWNYRPAQASGAAPGAAASGAKMGAPAAAAVAPASLSPSTLAATTLLHGAGWRTRFGVRDLVPQRGSTHEAICLGVPYSEHSSFRELALFLMALRIDKVVPTVNVGSDVSRKRMKAWTDRWLAERRRGGVVRTLSEGEQDSKAGKESRLWEGKDGQGGVAYW